MYPVSRITGEGRAEILRAQGPGFKQEGAGRGGAGGTGGAAQSVRGNYKSSKGTNLTVVEGMPRFLSCISCKSYGQYYTSIYKSSWM